MKKNVENDKTETKEDIIRIVSHLNDEKALDLIYWFILGIRIKEYDNSSKYQNRQ